MFENFKTRRARKKCGHVSTLMIERITKSAAGIEHSRCLRCKDCGEALSDRLGFNAEASRKALRAAEALPEGTSGPWPPERPWNERHFPALPAI